MYEGLETEVSVAPREGAWIEMAWKRARLRALRTVAPREGAWIEIRRTMNRWHDGTVAPREGAWIEIVVLRMQPQEV